MTILVDLYPNCGCFKPGQAITLIAEIETSAPEVVNVQLTITHLADRLTSRVEAHHLVAGLNRVQFGVDGVLPTHCGYAATVELLAADGSIVDRRFTAFDILQKWSEFPRYGFLSDFTPSRSDIEATIDHLARFHINGLQFYDWQYRHDQLVAPTPEYDDPLQRRLSLPTIRRLIETSHVHGIAAMPYLAIYGASVAFWRAHLSGALYDAEQQPMRFGDDFLGLMNPAPGSLWAKHLQAECANVLATLPFDGLHVDQYGEPKVAFDAQGDPVDLPAAFAAFVATLKADHPTETVAFNAVGNWPIEALATSQVDFVYIEIWPPDVTYQAVAQIVRNARRLSGMKAVVIALYLPAERIVNIRLLDAVILAWGGTRIELGENRRLLTDPYFPKHQPLSDDLEKILRRYADFLVCYGELMGPQATYVEDLSLVTPPGVWAVVRRNGTWLSIVLINLHGLEEPRWDQIQPEPIALESALIEIEGTFQPEQLFWASPDEEDLRPVMLTWQKVANGIHVTLPRLRYWGVLALRTTA